MRLTKLFPFIFLNTRNIRNEINAAELHAVFLPFGAIVFCNFIGQESTYSSATGPVIVRSAILEYKLPSSTAECVTNMNAFSLGGVHLLLDAVDAAMATALKGLLCYSVLITFPTLPILSCPILFCLVLTCIIFYYLIPFYLVLVYVPPLFFYSVNVFFFSVLSTHFVVHVYIYLFILHLGSLQTVTIHKAAVAEPRNTKEKVKPVSKTKNNTVILENLVTYEDASDPMLKGEIAAEAEKQGKLENIEIVIDKKKNVKIVLTYFEAQDAIKSYNVMNGRFFGGKTVIATLGT